MRPARPVMPWVKVYIKNEVSGLHRWCIDKLGPNGVNWYVGTGEAGADLFYCFRYEEDATAFKLKFEL
jgi:hypothetical protein